MSEQIDWTKEKYDDTLTSKVWFYTPFDSGDPRNRHYWEKVSKDEELLDIAAMEMSLEGIPEWVKSVGIDLAPPCGHFAFPEPFLQVLSSIGTANAVTANEGFKHQCWSVTPEWKRTAMDYCLCLDAWLAGASPEIPASELDAFAFRKIDFTMCGTP